MIYPENFESKIGFDKLRSRVRQLCLGEAGRLAVSDICFSNSYKKITHDIELTYEFYQLIQFGSPFPSQDYFNMVPEIIRIKTEGTYLDIEQMAELNLSYQTIGNVLQYFDEHREQYPTLFSKSQKTSYQPFIIDSIHKILDDSGQIKDGASDDLRSIRKEIREVRGTIDKRIRQIFQSMKREGIIAEEVEMTMRNGRCVIPVPVAGKRKIKGFIHDESASGQTVFIEPSEIFESNNSLRELENAEKKEIIKILKHFANSIRSYAEELIMAYHFLGEIDFIRAKACFAVETNSIKPIISDAPAIQWEQAINPILEKHLKNQGKKVTPLNLILHQNQRILVISGPNAGGKSVSLKTAGLLQYMLQSGFLVPVSPNSEFGVFSDILLEMGDEQSIENDLSTYSSHLKNLKYFLEKANPTSLFLIDEFGSGTEPQLGGAIAEATLMALNKKSALGIVSTHYANLKELAAQTDGIINGSMLYDVKNFTPLYKLNIGNSGSSYAFEIAEKIGFPADVIEKAIDIAGREKISFEKQLQQFESEKEALKALQDKLSVADSFFSELVDKYNTMTQKLESEKKAIIDKAKNEALQLVQSANAQIEKTIKQIKESQAEKSITATARTELKNFAHIVTTAEAIEKKVVVASKNKKTGLSKKQEPKIEKVVLPVKNGCYVRMTGQSQIGEVVEIKNNQARVMYDSLKINLTLEMLEVVSEKEFVAYRKKQRRAAPSELYKNINQKISDFKNTLDLRGKRAEEVLSIVEKQIDDAMILKVGEFRILHGKGFGVLRRVIREILSKHPNVSAFSDEDIEHGGDGITIVALKRQ